MKVAIHRAKNLNYLEDYPDMDIYVRVQLFYGHKCHRVKRTIARQGGTDIIFNESLSFTVNGKQMDSCNMAISLMLTASHVYSTAEIEHGRIVLGSFMFARGEGLVHWQEMLSQPKMATTHWHSLTNVAASP
uniref:C2 domain-containing protein n=1 Tax=Arion vulgaris TaxID=1028688 RepID=A0A0B6ZM76_9EUPU